MIEAERNGASDRYRENLKRIFESDLKRVFQRSICDALKMRIPPLKVRVKKEFLDETPPVPYVRKYTDEQLEWLGIYGFMRGEREERERENAEICTIEQNCERLDQTQNSNSS